MSIILTIVWVLIGYFFGSIPWGLIIGKVFYKTDIREYGSGNLGGTNAGRVLGKKAGIAVTILDALKAFAMMTICYQLTPDAAPYCGMAVCVGHCFPYFAGFKGGKAVACTFGYLLALGLFSTKDVVFTFFFPLLFFFMMLGLLKMVSLASMTSLVFASLIGFLTYGNMKFAITTLLITIFVIYRHWPNIKRIIHGKEAKVSYII